MPSNLDTLLKAASEMTHMSLNIANRKTHCLPTSMKKYILEAYQGIEFQFPMLVPLYHL
jgi:hypothetical protein